MTICQNLFNIFLTNINPIDESVKYAIQAHSRVRECLEKGDDFKEYVIGSFLYGSYKRHTAVGDIKDVDIVVLTNFDPNDLNDAPEQVLRKLKQALGRCYQDAGNPKYQRRSIRVDDPLPENSSTNLTLDVIPAVVVTNEDEPLKIPDKEIKKWIWTNPKGHIDKVSELNRDEVSNGKLVPLIKIMKWWWKYQCQVRQPDIERPKPKGFWIECLTLENFDRKKDNWAGHFVAVLENIFSKYSRVEQVPLLNDPGLPGEFIKTNMSKAEFDFFMNAIGDSLELAQKAIHNPDEVESSVIWRDIFGEQFPLSEPNQEDRIQLQNDGIDLGDTSHAKKPLWPMGLESRKYIRIDAFTYKELVLLGGINSNGRTLPDGLAIKYLASTNVKEPYEVYWQVVNTGEHAKRENGLRGDFFKGKRLDRSLCNNELENWEKTKYTGIHWIQCFVIKNGICVAKSKKFYVRIKNISR